MSDKNCSCLSFLPTYFFFLICAFFQISPFNLNAHLWSRSIPLSSVFTDSQDPQITTDGNGISYATFENRKGEIVLLTQIEPGKWPSPLDQVVLNSGLGTGKHPQIVVNESGNSLAVTWKDSLKQIWVWYRIQGGSPKVSLLSAPNTHSSRPKIAMNSSGDFDVAWLEKTRPEGTPEAKLVIVRRTVAGDFLYDNFSPADGKAGFDLDENNNGHRALTWVVEGNIYGSTNFNTGDWLTSQITFTGTSRNPKISVAQDGDATAIWVDILDGLFNIFISRKQSGGENPWQDPFIVSTTSSNPTPTLASKNNRVTHVVWSDNGHIKAWEVTGEISPDNPTVRFTTLSSTGTGSDPQVSQDSGGSGTTAVVWQQYSEKKDYQVLAAIKPIEGADNLWSPSRRLSRNSRSFTKPKIFVKGTVASVIWQKENLDTSTIFTAYSK